MEPPAVFVRTSDQNYVVVVELKPAQDAYRKAAALDGGILDSWSQESNSVMARQEGGRGTNSLSGCQHHAPSRPEDQQDSYFILSLRAIFRERRGMDYF